LDDPQGGSGLTALLSASDKEDLLRLARQSLSEHLTGRKLSRPGSVSSALRQVRAAFVTLRRRETAELRGCRGECYARRPLAESVAQMAIAAASDPRFAPVTVEELPDLRVEISALTPMEPIRADDVVVGRHGLMIAVGDRMGLLLPQVPVAQGWDKEAYLNGLCRKAGLPGGAWNAEGVQLFSFEAEVWGEDE
jgi:AmmeMemoRadiSam system protein A